MTVEWLLCHISTIYPNAGHALTHRQAASAGVGLLTPYETVWPDQDAMLKHLIYTDVFPTGSYHASMQH